LTRTIHEEGKETYKFLENEAEHLKFFHRIASKIRRINEFIGDLVHARINWIGR
jgi:hypothetical protein